MNLLFAIAFHAGDAPQTEKLLDFIYRQSGRITQGHVLLAAASDVHAEMRTRIKISAEMAFETVHELEVRPLADAQATKNLKLNSAFRQTAQHVADCFKWPFLWMEPDCVPTHANWRRLLWLAYQAQPKPYFGSRMKVLNEGRADTFFMARNGIYDNRAVFEIFTAEPFKWSFDIVSGETIIPKFTPTKLIQQALIVTEDDLSKVNADAILVHGDKNGHLMRKIGTPSGPPVEMPVTPPTVEPTHVAVQPDVTPISEPIAVTPAKRGRGRPSKAEMAARVSRVEATLNGHL